MYPDEISPVPPEDHNASAPAPDSVPTPPPAPEPAPVAPPAPQYAPPAAPPTAPAPQPQYAPAPQAGPAPAPQYAPVNTGTPDQPLGEAQGLSIAGMVLGIISIPFCMSIVFGIVGLILSIMGAKKTPEGVKNTYAKAGKICSIIGLVLGVLVWCAYILIIILAINSANSTVNSLSTF